MTAPRRQRDPIVRIGLALAGGLVLALAWPLATDRVHVRGDLATFNLPIRAFYADALAAGDSPVWWPGIWSGYFLHGESQMGMFHPLHALLFGLLPLGKAFGIELVLAYPLMLAGTFLLLRRFGVPAGAAVLGGLVFAFSGWSLRHFQHMNTLTTIAHLPWLLWAIERAMRADAPKVRARARCALALLTASQILLGFPQFVAFTALVEVLFLAFLKRPGPVSRWLGLGTAKALGAFAGAVQVLPSIDFLRSQAVRADPGTSFLLAESFHPPNLALPIAPYLFTGGAFDSDHENAFYFGAVATVLVLWLALRWRHLPRPERRLAAGAGILGALSLLFALGKHAGIYALIVQLPVLGLFRVPARYLVLTAFAAGIACAVAWADLDRVARRRPFASWQPLRPLVSLVAASVAIAALGLALRGSDSLVASQLAPAPAVLAGPLLVTLAATLVAFAARGYRVAMPLLVVFLVLDLGVYGLLDTYREPPKTIDELVASREGPPSVDDGRIDSNDTALTLAGARLTGGYTGLIPTPRLDPSDPATRRVAGVRWRVDPPIAPEKDRQVTPGQVWLPVDDPLPRARLVAEAIVSNDPRRDIGLIDPSSTALVDQPIALEPGPPGTVQMIRDRPGNLLLTTDAPTRQLLVVAETWHRGWQCTTGEETIEAMRTNGDIMGCVVEPGRQDVALTFRPASLRIGRWISAIALIGSFILLLPIRMRRW